MYVWIYGLIFLKKFTLHPLTPSLRCKMFPVRRVPCHMFGTFLDLSTPRMTRLLCFVLTLHRAVALNSRTAFK